MRVAFISDKVTFMNDSADEIDGEVVTFRQSLIRETVRRAKDLKSNVAVITHVRDASDAMLVKPKAKNAWHESSKAAIPLFFGAAVGVLLQIDFGHLDGGDFARVVIPLILAVCAGVVHWFSK